MANKEATRVSAHVDRVLEASTADAGAGALGSAVVVVAGAGAGVDGATVVVAGLGVAAGESASHVAPPVAAALRVKPTSQVESTTREAQVAALVRHPVQPLSV